LPTFRIYTEGGKLTEKVASIAAKHFPNGFTIFEGRGHWQGGSEPAAVVEIVQPKSAKHEVEETAREIRQENNQSAVLVTDTACKDCPGHWFTKSETIEAPPPKMLEGPKNVG